jgi:DNA-binding SARP family transcriptional activator
LLCNPGSQEREWLANLLWDSGSHESVLNNLSKSLTNLRDLLPNLIESSRNQIRVNREQVYFDALEFEMGLAQVQCCKPSYAQFTPSQAKTLVDLLSLYKGDFLKAVHLRGAKGFEEWLLLKQGALRSAYLAALHELAQYYLLQGQYTEGLVYSRLLLGHEPYNEAVVEQVLQLAYFNESIGDIQQIFADFWECFLREYGTEPSPHLQKLYEAMKAGRYSLKEMEAPDAQEAQLAQFLLKCHDNFNARQLVEAFMKMERDKSTIKAQLRAFCEILEEAESYVDALA